MMVRYLTFEQWHNKRDIGSTRLRVHNMIKFWPEAGLYQYGENPDVMIYQKVYEQADWKFMEHFKGIQILDICDPDWMEQQDVKRTIDLMDAVTCPTEALAEFLRQLTDKPVVILPDRHDMTLAPPMRTQPPGIADKALWFGYKQNSELMRFVIPTLERLQLPLKVLSNEDPMMWRWADDPDAYQPLYEFVKYDESEFYSQITDCTVCLLPEGTRPQDRFKSNNRTTRAWLLSLPVAKTGDELREVMSDPKLRNHLIEESYKLATEEYDIRKSVKQMRELIGGLRESQHIRV